MIIVDKELEVISVESLIQRENIKDEVFFLSENFLDLDDESFLSESLISFDFSFE